MLRLPDTLPSPLRWAVALLAIGAIGALGHWTLADAAALQESETPSQETEASEEVQAPRSSNGFLVAKGRTTFRIYCANCHGPEGRGDGNLAEMLKVRPANLTELAKNAKDGKFPREEVHAKIDGRKPVAGHGSPDMPIWGDAFQKVLQPGYHELSDEERTHLKIVELVYFLESIQEPLEP